MAVAEFLVLAEVSCLSYDLRDQLMLLQIEALGGQFMLLGLVLQVCAVRWSSNGSRGTASLSYSVLVLIVVCVLR